jgi:hypothetical protein
MAMGCVLAMRAGQLTHKYLVAKVLVRKISLVLQERCLSMYSRYIVIAHTLRISRREKHIAEIGDERLRGP